MSRRSRILCLLTLPVLVFAPANLVGGGLQLILVTATGASLIRDAR